MEIVDPVDNYWTLMKCIFPIEGIKKLVSRSDFKVRLDSMNGGMSRVGHQRCQQHSCLLLAVTGVYTQRIFRDELGMSADSLTNFTPKEDFGGLDLPSLALLLPLPRNG